MAALEARSPPMGTRSADPLNAAVRRENAGSTWGAPGIDGANNKVSSAFMPIWADWAAESLEARTTIPTGREPRTKRGTGGREQGREGPFVYLPIYLSGAGIVLLGFGRLCVLNNGLGTNSLGSTRVPTLESLPSLPPAPAFSAALAGIEIAGQNGEK